jgi:ubiquinone/menaquinone biosynthesis C-methylase UbiE
MRLLLLPSLLCLSLAAQVADYANSGYRTEQARARVALTLIAHDREDTQKPHDLVAQMKLTPGMTVADIGTGVGFMLPYLHAAVGPSGRILAEDIFPDFLDKARARAAEKKLDNVEFILGTERDPKLPPESIDVILVLDVYHHFDYPEQMLAGMRAALKPGGRLVLVDFYKEGFRDPMHIRLDEHDVAREVTANGFELLSSRPFIEGRQYIATFRRK